MNLKQFQQSELKRFDEKFSGFIPDNDFVNEFDLKKFVSSSIEKAYALGKEEKEKELTQNALNRNNPDYLSSNLLKNK